MDQIAAATAPDAPDEARSRPSTPPRCLDRVATFSLRRPHTHQSPSGASKKDDEILPKVEPRRRLVHDQRFHPHLNYPVEALQARRSAA